MGTREAAAILRRAARGASVPAIRYDESLPVHTRRAEIAAAIATSPVVIVSGATGSGKSTQIPKICLELGRGLDGMIGHTQPRRIAAHALASRLAAELGTAVGDLVGYQVRFVDRTGPRTLVKLMTDGVLLRELERDPWLNRYDTLILDEAHERNLNLDFLLGICRRLVKRRPELRVVVTSATIETRRFAEYFDGAPVVEVEGRSFPIELRYRPIDPDEEAPTLLASAVQKAVSELADDSRGIKGDTLVFLPGERQIQESLELLKREGPGGYELLPLYSRLSTPDQERIYASHALPRVILATNVAETSLTIPGVRFVVDSGLARISRYSPRAKLQRLPIEPVSRASADQRKGRCGREGEGICVRLYAEEDFATRPEYTEPEIRRTNLASLILQMAALGLGAPEEFPFLDPPDARLLNDGYRLLAELSAVDGERRITQLGRRMARLPVDPRLARILVEAARLGVLRECLVIVAFLSIPDPRERPTGRLEAADERHAAFADPRSDFVMVQNLWGAIGEQAAAGSRALRRFCRDNFLSWPRIREWQDLHAELTSIARSPRRSAEPATAPHAALHRALLSGFLGGIGVRDDERTYLGARDTRFVIAPGTPLARRRPHWVMAASLVETGRVYARMVAQIQPSWIEAAASHLVRRSYDDAEWSAERGMVLARETVSLYGRVLHTGRMIDFAKVDPATARRIFVEEALVRDRGGPQGAFRTRNAAAIAAIQHLEAKLRRRDLLVGDAAIADFFLERIPSLVSDLRGFRRWWQVEEAAQPAHARSAARAAARRSAAGLCASRFSGLPGYRRQRHQTRVRVRYGRRGRRRHTRAAAPAVVRGAAKADRAARPRLAARQGRRDTARVAEGASPVTRADPGRRGQVPRRSGAAHGRVTGCHARGIRHRRVRDAHDTGSNRRDRAAALAPDEYPRHRRSGSGDAQRPGPGRIAPRPGIRGACAYRRHVEAWRRSGIRRWDFGAIPSEVVGDDQRRAACDAPDRRGPHRFREPRPASESRDRRDDHPHRDDTAGRARPCRSSTRWCGATRPRTASSRCGSPPPAWAATSSTSSPTAPSRCRC